MMQAEVHMFSVFTHVFARHTIVPRMDYKGSPVPLDLESFLPRRETTMIVATPPSYQVRFVPRTKHLVQ